MAEEAIRDKALQESGVLQPIANCRPQALYYQRHDVTESLVLLPGVVPT